MSEIEAILSRLLAPGAGPTALATLVSVEGSSYRRPGARLLVASDGSYVGSISGGCLEQDLLARAARVLASGEPETVIYDTTSENDVIWGVGLGCHGVVRVLVEKLPPSPAWARALAFNIRERRLTELAVVLDGAHGDRLGTCLAPELTGSVEGAGVFRQTVRPPVSLVIFGAGDDAKPLVRLGKELGWVITVADPRPAFATVERFPSADTVVIGEAGTLAAKAMLDADSVAVVMTHHYVHDVPLLRTLLPQPLAYLGLLGPRKRAERILADLAAEGIQPTPEQMTRLHAPVGLDLGADGPEQVALAIVAEIQAVLSARNARPLRERTAPIHAGNKVVNH